MKKIHFSLLLNVILIAVITYLVIDINSCKMPETSQTYLEETFYCDFNDTEFNMSDADICVHAVSHSISRNRNIYALKPFLRI